ncbi:winged helix-turn-helix transcriptional regulator [Caldiplasma sukawensis]
MINEKSPMNDICPVVETVKIIGGRWELIILKSLVEKPMRFNEILREADGISSRTLSRILRRLMELGIIKREVLSLQPVTIMYSVTEKGNDIKPVIVALQKWGEKYLKEK